MPGGRVSVVPSATSTGAALSQLGKGSGKPQAARTSAMMGLANGWAGPQELSAEPVLFEKSAAHRAAGLRRAKRTEAATRSEFGASTLPPAKAPSFTPILPAASENPFVRNASVAKSTYVLKSRLGCCADARSGKRTRMAIAMMSAHRLAGIWGPLFVETKGRAWVAPLATR